MANEEKSLTLSLAEGVTETVAEEVAGGVITESINTRLGVSKGTVTKRLADTELDSDIAGTPVCGGMVAGPGGATVAYFKPATGTRRVVGDVVEDVVSPVLGEGPQNAYFPIPMTAAGAVPGSALLVTPATVYDADGRLWTAVVRAQGAGWAVYLTVTSGEQTVITTRAVVPLTATGSVYYRWVGLTFWNDFVQVWYSEDAGISARQLQIDAGNELVVGPASLVYTPLGAALTPEADVVADGSHAYLITRDASTDTTVRVNKVQLLSFAVVGTIAFTSTANTATFTYLSVAVHDGKLAVAISASVADTTYGVIDAASMTGTLAFTHAYYGTVGVQPLELGGDSWFVFACSTQSADPVAAPTHTKFYRVTTAGVADGDSTLYWYHLQARGAFHTVSAGEVYPYWPLQRWWSAGSLIGLPVQSGDEPSEYVIDPSVDLFTPCPYAAGSFTLTAVARYGVDRACIPPLGAHCSQSIAVSATGRLTSSYLTRDLGAPLLADYAFSARWVELDLAPQQQPGVAVLPTETGMVAGALPAVWDGVETTEAAYLHTPRVWVEESGGAGPTTTGTFLVSAVISRRDANGNTTRSAPALPFPVTLAGTSPIAYVSVPTSMRDGLLQEGYTVTLYWTTDGDSILRANWSEPTDIVDGMVVFESIQPQSELEPPIYSDGSGTQELLPVCPPPSRDLRSIGGRLWAIDAESNTVWPSKLIEPGIVPEFSANLVLTDFDAQYGKLLAVADVGGAPHVLAERGVYVIDGYGPDNIGRGGRFSVRLASNIGCRGRHTVATIPSVGVLFQANDGRFVMIGGGFKRFDTFGVYDVCAPAIFAESHEVAYPLQEGGGWVVYDWVMDAWTHWSGAYPS